MPRFSIVVPTYNRRATVGRAVASILDQDVDDIEVIVVDDGSTDGTADDFATAPDDRVQFVRQANAGAGPARNTGAERATGDILTFLDSDDEALPGWLAAYAAKFDAGADIVSCAVVDEPGGTVRRPHDFGAVFGGLVGMFAHGGTYALRLAIFRKVGGFAPGLLSAEHTEFAYRLLPAARDNGWRVDAMDEPYIRHVVGSPASLRANDRAVLQGAQYLLAHHETLLAQEPGRVAAHAATGGVRAVRLGQIAEARRLFAMARRDQPRNPRHWLRWGATFAPPLARRLWRPA